MAPAVEDREDSDPIKASYDVYIKPQIQDGRQVYIFQFPNRDASQDYSEANNAKPVELRIKPKTGMVELDVPLDAYRNYDRAKGATWGEAMRKVNMKGGGNYGLPGGFGIGGNTAAGRRGKEEGDDDVRERIMADYPAAVAQQRVLVKQTLGGQVVPKETAGPQYMVGTFRKSKSSSHQGMACISIGLLTCKLQTNYISRLLRTLCSCVLNSTI
jgi:DNA-directed RNA polymerase-3 subunit RPC5